MAGFDYVESVVESLGAIKDREMLFWAGIEVAVSALWLAFAVALFFFFNIPSGQGGKAAFFSLAAISLAVELVAMKYAYMRLSMRALGMSGYRYREGAANFIYYLAAGIKAFMAQAFTWYDKKYFAAFAVCGLTTVALLAGAWSVTDIWAKAALILAGSVIFIAGALVYALGFFYHEVRLIAAPIFYLQYAQNPLSVPRAVWDMGRGKTTHCASVLIVGWAIIQVAVQFLSGLGAIFGTPFLLVSAMLAGTKAHDPFYAASAGIVLVFSIAAWMATRIFGARYQVALLRSLDPNFRTGG